MFSLTKVNFLLRTAKSPKKKCHKKMTFLWQKNQRKTPPELSQRALDCKNSATLLLLAFKGAVPEVKEPFLQLGLVGKRIPGIIGNILAVLDDIARNDKFFRIG